MKFENKTKKALTAEHAEPAENRMKELLTVEHVEHHASAIMALIREIDTLLERKKRPSLPHHSCEYCKT